LNNPWKKNLSFTPKTFCSWTWILCIKDSKTSPSYTIGVKHYPKFIKGLFRLNVPGVGTYTLSKDKDFEVPCFKIGKEERKNIIK